MVWSLTVLAYAVEDLLYPEQVLIDCTYDFQELRNASVGLVGDLVILDSAF